MTIEFTADTPVAPGALPVDCAVPGVVGLPLALPFPLPFPLPLADGAALPLGRTLPDALALGLPLGLVVFVPEGEEPFALGRLTFASQERS